MCRNKKEHQGIIYHWEQDGQSGVFYVCNIKKIYICNTLFFDFDILFPNKIRRMYGCIIVTIYSIVCRLHHPTQLSTKIFIHKYNVGICKLSFLTRRESPFYRVQLNSITAPSITKQCNIRNTIELTISKFIYTYMHMSSYFG